MCSGERNDPPGTPGAFVTDERQHQLPNRPFGAGYSSEVRWRTIIYLSHYMRCLYLSDRRQRRAGAEVSQLRHGLDPVR